jgi:adenine-specific DNA-methyltransferase
MGRAAVRERYHGRLELTWTNKDLALLAHEDGSYAWVPPTDYRVAEVRLLREVAQVGDAGSAGTRDNLLIRGDALNALAALRELPAYAERYVGEVKLAYLDPPFNTQQSFLQYDDALEHSVWLTLMRDRLQQIRDLLAPDGSVWVHVDDSEQAHLRVTMDELFGRQNFVATVVWQKVHAPKSSARHFSSDHDYLLVYAQDAEQWGRNALPRTAWTNREFWNPDDDPRGLWRRSDLTASKPYREGQYEVTGPTGATFTPRTGRYWGVSQATFEELRVDNRLWWGKSGDSFPFRKRFLSEVGDLTPTTVWLHEQVGNNREAKQEVTNLFGRDAIFATPKPERLLQRVVQLASDPGDIVLDCFLGSGTTAAVAHKMGRHWVGVERSHDTLDTFAIPRLSKVCEGRDVGGITADVGWAGGGGFRVLDVAPSMFEDDDGVIVLADWAVNGALAEATAAQLGYRYELAAPFCGHKGRSRLAVIDGLVNPTVIELLVGALGEDEQLTVCGTSVDPETAKALRELRPGSRVRKIPASLLTEYQEATRWRPRLVERTDAPADEQQAADMPHDRVVEA